jgi:hypothetical protein
MSLDKAAGKYLGEHKSDIETKDFTRGYVNKNRAEIESYCQRDAELVSKLYRYLVDGLTDIDLVPSNLYSVASLSLQYFKNTTGLVTVWRFWKRYRDLLRYACESYSGGKFEVYRRGVFDGVTYDINSAYPYQIANLIDITNARVVYDKRYRRDATYGFLRVYINNDKARHVSASIKIGLLNIYPSGVYHNTITKEEYEYLKSIKVKVKIISAYWLYVRTPRRRFKKTVEYLYHAKQEYKGKDKRMYMIMKTLLNAFYGKLAQLIQTESGDLRAGLAWNPIYASIITANTRIELSRICEEYTGHVHAVHTDSIITDKELSKEYLGSKLGQWTKETEGKGIVIACGLYQHADKVAYRGFKMCPCLNWFDILEYMKKKNKINLPQREVLSWVEANFRGDDNRTNVFGETEKIIDLNCDQKRIWFEKVNARDLLNGNYESMSRVVTNFDKPIWWG